MCCDFDEAVMVNVHRKAFPLVIVSLMVACTGAEDEVAVGTTSSSVEKQSVGREISAAAANAAKSGASADTQARIAQLRVEIGATQERQASLEQRRTDLSQQIERHQADSATLLATIKSARRALQAEQAAGAIGKATKHFDEIARIRLEKAFVEDQRLVSELTEVGSEIDAVSSRRQALMQEVERLTSTGSFDVVDM
jgi:chromosome segregation ATPase